MSGGTERKRPGSVRACTETQSAAVRPTAQFWPGKKEGAEKDSPFGEQKDRTKKPGRRATKPRS